MDSWMVYHAEMLRAAIEIAQETRQSGDCMKGRWWQQMISVMWYVRRQRRELGYFDVC